MPMTESKWLACTDPQKMLGFLRGKASDRKLRLLAAAAAAWAEMRAAWPRAAWVEEVAAAARSALLRDLFRNPFHPVPIIDPAWLVWNGGVVRKMAQAIYDARRFTDLPILADALEEAGCTNAEILSHCRGPGPHVRGCWAVDLILGQE
jgi:hypothetical protein